MASLNLSNFAQYAAAGDRIDYLEVRLGEQYVVPFTMLDAAGVPIDITGWTFSVTSDIYTADFVYGGPNGDLLSVNSFTDQAQPPAPAGLTVVVTDAAAGQGVLQIPQDVNPNPTSLVTADGENTLLNIITITSTYPSSQAGFDNIRKLLLGLIVRFGG